MKEVNKNTDEYALFLKYSKEIGIDPTMIQAAGGNTSLKQGNTMWVKASGKWLCDAQSDELMVPMSISKIKEVLEDKKCSDNDLIIISDVDEIPDLTKLDKISKKKNIQFLFKKNLTIS